MTINTLLYIIKFNNEYNVLLWTIFKDQSTLKKKNGDALLQFTQISFYYI